MPNYQFDALQYCRSNMGHSKMANGRDPMELIAAELERNLYIIEVWKRRPAMNVWAECDKCDCLFIPGGKGSETTCATCIKEAHNSLREAVKKMLEADRSANEPHCIGDYIAARAEVDRLMEGK